MDFTDFLHYRIDGYAINYPSTESYAAQYYKYSTNNWGASADVHYVSPLILLKYLPWFNDTYCRENLIWHSNYSSHAGYYNVFGYSISEIFLFMEIGMYAAFEDVRFHSFGLNIKMNLY